MQIHINFAIYLVSKGLLHLVESLLLLLIKLFDLRVLFSLNVFPLLGLLLLDSYDVFIHFINFLQHFHLLNQVISLRVDFLQSDLILLQNLFSL